jgi:hypothetical protein
VFLALIFITSSPVFAQGSQPSLFFSPETIQTKAGETFQTEVEIDTAGASVGGVGAKIIFDPQRVQVTNIETFPVFPDYPAKTFDNTAGTVTISGIVNSKDAQYTGKAKFATISWKAVNGGSADISFDFQPNSTKDSNIAVLYGNGDILEKVNSVSVSVAGTENPANTGLDSTDLSYPRVGAPPSSTAPQTKSFFVYGLVTFLVISIVGNIILLRKLHQLEKEKKSPLLENPQLKSNKLL